MTVRRGFLAVGVAVALLGVIWLLRPRDRRPPPVTHPASLEQVLPAELQKRLREARSVEAVLVESIQIQPLADHDVPAIRGYAIRSRPIPLSADQQRELVTRLLERKSYQN